MKLRTFQSILRKSAARLLALPAFLALVTSVTFGQTTPQTAAGTAITNQASATYSDGNGNTYSTVSNTVTVTVAKVAGLEIKPDGGTVASVVPGQTGVLYPFTVTNLGNFSDQVLFLQGGKSITVAGTGTVTRAVIDVDGSGTINAGDTDIFTNTAGDVTSAMIAQNGSIVVLVEVSIGASAAPGTDVVVTLGDAGGATPFDNQPANSSVNEVRTVSTQSVNGLREAKGDVRATVQRDAQLVLTLTAPTGPVSAATATTPGSDIVYNWNLCNTGLRAASAITLTGAPSGANTGVFIFAPIPVGTTLKSGQTFPAGTLYTTSPLTIAPTAATWTTAPSDLTTVRRVAFNVGASLAAGACIPQIDMAVTVTTTNATNDIYQIGDVFANNQIGSLITDQSGDTVANTGDGNANYNEGNQPGNIDGNGIQQITTLQRLGSVLIGPATKPAAVGPNSNNDDYTNRSLSVPGIPQGGVTTAAGVLVYTNTLQNTGNANDTFNVGVTGAPAGFKVEISTNGGTTYTEITAATPTVSVAINFGQTADIMVRITAPTGTEVLKADGYPVTIRATSGLTTTAFNETIDRLYTGVLWMNKTALVINNTGVGGATDAVPGAEIEYTITYRNISSTGGTDNALVTVTNLVITENGAVAPNNWAASTTQKVGSASDSLGGTLTGDVANSTVLTDTITSVAPQITGTFKFRRVIK